MYGTGKLNSLINNLIENQLTFYCTYNATHVVSSLLPIIILELISIISTNSLLFLYISTCIYTFCT